MKTIILCGGIGYRLKEETEFKPKPMVHVGNKPILWHIMKIYAHYGFNEFIIALGYKGDYIKEYFLNQKYFQHNFTLSTKTGFTKIHRDKTDSSIIDDFQITFVDTGQETPVGERILKCKEYLDNGDSDFMVTYGDGVGDIDISSLVKFHKENKIIGTITGVNPTSKYGLLKTKGNLVYEFVEKPHLNDWINGGFMVFDKRFFEYLKVGEMEHPALKRLALDEQLNIYRHDGFWSCMDTYADVEKLNEYWKNDPKWKIWE
jgi:glucose-1-phosphate cytidylyltransferase